MTWDIHQFFTIGCLRHQPHTSLYFYSGPELLYELLAFEKFNTLTSQSIYHTIRYCRYSYDYIKKKWEDDINRLQKNLEMEYLDGDVSKVICGVRPKSQRCLGHVYTVIHAYLWQQTNPWPIIGFRSRWKNQVEKLLCELQATE